MKKYLQIVGLLLITNLYGEEIEEQDNAIAQESPHAMEVSYSPLNIQNSSTNQTLLGTFSIYYTPKEKTEGVEIVENFDNGEEFSFDEDDTAQLARTNRGVHPKKCKPKECCYPYATGCPRYYPPDRNIFFAWGEWLLWKPLLEDDLRWIIVEEIPVSNANGQIEVFNEKSLNYTWESGFRIGAGFRFSCDLIGCNVRPWQMDATFAKIIATVTPQQFETNDQNTLVLLRQLPTNNAPTQIDRAKGEARLSYEHLNGRVSWPVWFNDNVIFRFMTGPAFAWVDQSVQATYNQIFEADPTIFDLLRTELKWKFVGGGLLGASDVYLSIGKGFGFFIDGSFELLVGRMRSLERYFQTELDNSVFIERDTKYTRDFMQFKPIFTFGSGIDFKCWLAKCFMIHVLVGYEFNALINMNQLGKLNQRTDSSVGILQIAPKGAVFNAKASNLYFHGLNVRAGFDF